MKLTGTFLDEISHDIPSQNWGEAEWDRDFRTMKSIGIDTVIIIRCGYRRWLTWPSSFLQDEEGCYAPPVDLVEMFLSLAGRHGMALYFGTYDSGKYWLQGQYQKEVDISRRVIDEVWDRYGHHEAFRGWYLSLEVNRNIHSILDIYTSLAKHCKEVSGGLPVFISPSIEGVKAVSAFSTDTSRKDVIDPAEHEREWDEIMAAISGCVDIVAFQDGHVDFHELPDYLSINKALAEKHGLSCWTNCETFDRDMPIKFLPIKWEKLLLKLQAAKNAGVDKAITFEFPHFLSPHSCYPQAHGLFKRYSEHFGISRKDLDE